MNWNAQPLLPKQNWRVESQTENHWHSKCKCICYATTTLPHE